MFDSEKKREKEMDSKEQVYDEVLKPLVDRLYDLAKEQGIPFIAAFEVSEEVIVGSYSLTECKTSQLGMAALILEGTASVEVAVLPALQQVPVKVVD